MIGVARVAEPGTKGFDSLDMLTDGQLVAFASHGFEFVGAYLEVLAGPGGADYVARCFAHGLALLPICEARTSPTQDAGASSALLELSRCHSLGVPQGVHTVVDFEAFVGDPAVGCAYVDAFAGGLEAGGQPAILYVAQPEPLTAGQLYARPAVHLYWSGASDNPDLPCGYSIFQGLPVNYRPAWGLGAQVDLDWIVADRRGRLPTLWAPA